MPKSLTLGSDVEIAQQVLRVCRGKSSAPVAYANGWRVYCGTHWREGSEHALRKVILDYDGATYPTTNGTGKVRMNAARLNSIETIAKQIASRVAPQLLLDPTPGLSFRNGFLRITETGLARLDPHSPDQRALHMVDIACSSEEYSSKCPTWISVLRKVWHGCTDLADRIECLRQFVGLALLGYGTRFNRCLLFPGDGANGKSTVIDACASLFPPGSVTASSPQSWAEPYFRARLAGAKLNVCSELPSKKLTDTDVFKDVVDGAQINARLPYEPPFDFRPMTGHIFAVNELPATHDQSHGFWRRFAVIDFPNTFDGNVSKAEILRSLEPEQTAMIGWAIEGAQAALSADKLTVPKSADKQRALWQSQSDQAMQFLTECCDNKTDGELAIDELYVCFREWCEQTGHTRPMTRQTFAKKLGQRGLRKRITSGPNKDCNRYALAVRPRASWGL